MPDNISKSFPIIETSRLVLRDIQARDARQFFDLRSDEEVMKYMDSEPCRVIEEAKKMIDSSIETYTKEKGIIWAITFKNSDILIGYAGFWKWIKEHFRAELAYALPPAYWGKGIMGEALGAILGFGFDKMNLHRIEADVNPGNIPSIKLLEKLNFKREAYFKENRFFRGKFCDSAIYALLEPGKTGGTVKSGGFEDER